MSGESSRESVVGGYMDRWMDRKHLIFITIRARDSLFFFDRWSVQVLGASEGESGLLQYLFTANVHVLARSVCEAYVYE